MNQQEQSLLSQSETIRQDILNTCDKIKFSPWLKLTNIAGILGLVALSITSKHTGLSSVGEVGGTMFLMTVCVNSLYLRSIQPVFEEFMAHSKRLIEVRSHSAIGGSFAPESHTAAPPAALKLVSKNSSAAAISLQEHMQHYEQQEQKRKQVARNLMRMK